MDIRKVVILGKRKSNTDFFADEPPRKKLKQCDGQAKDKFCSISSKDNINVSSWTYNCCPQKRCNEYPTH